MKLKYDLHIHSCLSPCADNDMTPNNIVALSKMIGLDVIAVTDHNAMANSVATVKAACMQGGILALPGMEMETLEEVHLICLFCNIEDAQAFYRDFCPFAPTIKNNPEIYGKQIIMDEHDNETGIEERLLVSASALSLDNAVLMVKKHNGACVPAHVDKQSYSIISNLGFISEEMGFGAVEIYFKDELQKFLTQNPYLSEYRIIHNSDAHHLCDILTGESELDILEGRENDKSVIGFLSNFTKT